jgi:hypothetical protein
MKNQIVAAFKKNQIAVAFKNQIVVAFIIGGAIIIAPAIVIIALIRLGHERGIGAALARPASHKARVPIGARCPTPANRD